MPYGQLTIDQSFQQIYGTYDIDGINMPIEDGWLRGSDVQFTINRVEYTGRIAGDTMTGTAKGRTISAWSATRLK